MRLVIFLAMLLLACSNKDYSDVKSNPKVSKQSFSMMDLNGNGFLSHQEWTIQEKRAAEVIPEQSRRQYIQSLEHIFNNMDQNHDGNVSFDEFSARTANQSEEK